MPPGGGHSSPASQMNKDHFPLTRHDDDAPPIPSTETMQEQEQTPLGSLPEGPLLDILSRVPYRSLCRFKCVSKPWLAFCSDPDIRKKSSHTLSGFFYNDHGRSIFRNLSGEGPPMVDPSLPFLLKIYAGFTVKQCSGGLLLCKCWENDQDDHVYVVCNPMTGQWAVLPPVVLHYPYDPESLDMFLGFEADVPSHFTVFVRLPGFLDSLAEMAIYSSKTERWTKVMSEREVMAGISQGVFLNDRMHLATYYSTLFTVNAKGDVWRHFSMPHNRISHFPIGHSLGRLHAWHIDNGNHSQLYVWVLEDYVSAKWTLKHTATVSELFGRQRGKDGMSYTAFAIHPDCNCICLADEGGLAVSYDMDNQKVNVICTLPEFKNVLPYVPCFEEWS